MSKNGIRDQDAVDAIEGKKAIDNFFHSSHESELAKAKMFLVKALLHAITAIEDGNEEEALTILKALTADY